MKVFTSVTELRSELNRTEQSGIGFVPTMGALHAGHRSLVERARKENATVVVSVFVNPTQFNDKNDLRNYPRTPEADRKLLEEAGADFVLMPSVEEIYPEEDTRVFDFGQIDKVMEGATRPGHFNGVAQVVSRLFDIVRPARAYFGEKDFQQIAVIKAMVAQLRLPVEIVECPIVRGDDGLALSSRNQLLDAPHRAAAPHIYAVLRRAAEKSHELTPAGLKAWVTAEVESDPRLKVIYYQSVDALTMQEVPAWDASERIQGCIAVQAGDIRLIDIQIEVIKSKIHRVTVTQADLNYVGSITIDEALMEAANMIEGEKVQIMDINNGERFETYIIKGERGSGCICLNGAAARKVQVGDVIIIASYALMDFEEAKQFRPWIVFPDTATNRLVE